MATRMSKDRVTSLIRWMRDALSQRVYNNALRYEDLIAPRSIPKPNLPGGVHHKLSANDYFKRNGRGQATPPEIIYQNNVKAIESGKIASTSDSNVSKTPTPGVLFGWDKKAPNWPNYWYEYNESSKKK